MAVNLRDAIARHPRWTVASLCALAALAYTLFFSPYHPDRTPKMDNIPPKIEALFKTTKTVCFGRFMLDVPAQAKVVWGVAEIPDDFRAYPGEGHKTKLEIKAKIDKLTEEKHYSEPSMLVEVVDSVNEYSKVVVGYKNTLDNDRFQLYSYIRLDKVAFVQSTPNAIGQGDGKTDYKDLVEDLLSVARRLRLRAETEIPEEPGICVEEGFVSAPLDYDREVIRVGFRFPEYPDVSFSIETYSMDVISEEDTLDAAWERGQEAAGIIGALSSRLRIKKLRWGNRAIGQWEGAEGLLRLPSHNNGPESHEFLFKTPGVGMDLLRPSITINLYTGVDGNARSMVQPSLTDAEAIAVWDKLTSTIRVRPTKEPSSDDAPSPAPEPDAKAPDAPPHKLATGDTCTRTGLWRCVENGKTMGFIEGQAMPEAVFVKPATGLFDRIKGVKQTFSHKAPGHWEWAGEEKSG